MSMPYEDVLACWQLAEREARHAEQALNDTYVAKLEGRSGPTQEQLEQCRKLRARANAAFQALSQHINTHEPPPAQPQPETVTPRARRLPAWLVQ